MEVKAWRTHCVEHKSKIKICSYTLSQYIFLFFLKILFIYLTEGERHRERGTQAGGVGGREACFPRSREPDVGLNSRTQ